jgi:transposase-like protein
VRTFLSQQFDLALILRTGLCEEKDTAMNEKSPFGRRYDREFKDNAVALVRGGKRITAVARDLGVSPWALGRWVQAANGGQAQSEPKTLAEETPEQRELRRLRQENDYLRQQRDILKKALGILSAEMPPHATR